MEELQERIQELTQQLEAAQAANTAIAQANAGNHHELENAHIDAYQQRIKVPRFYQNNPTIWFNIIEALFRSKRIRSEKTRADVVIAELDADIALSIADLLTLDPVPDDIYTRVKTRLISTYSASSEAQLRQLLKGEVLSSGKPSHILSRIRNLSGGRCSEDILRTIFLDQLPAQHRAILASVTFESLDKLALTADRINDATSSVSDYPTSVASIQTSNNKLESKLDQITAEISEIKTRINKSENSDYHRYQRSRSKSRSNKPHSHPRDKSFNKNRNLCWYHKKFSKLAKKCIEPCDWVERGEKTEN